LVTGTVPKSMKINKAAVIINFMVEGEKKKWQE
jgi:hypothetical protein